MSGPALRLSGVTRVFAGGLAALAPLDLTLAPGEIVALIGPSGCGKSTALRIAAGLDAPSAGRVERNAAPVSFVFQDATLMPWADARTNVALPLSLTGLPRADVHARADAALAELGLGGFETALPRALSGGMRMRVSLARALVTRPNLLFLDEPFGALDEITRDDLTIMLGALLRGAGAAALLVTHSAREAAALADRVLVLSPRPARIAAEIAVPQALRRNADGRRSPEFAALALAVSDGLRAAMARAA